MALSDHYRNPIEADRLRRDNEVLRERVAVLSAALIDTVNPIPAEWGLTKSESVILGVMVNREIATLDAIMTALYATRSDEPGSNIVAVFITRMRRKLSRHGVKITTHWGNGWSLDWETRKRLRQRK